MVTTESSAQAAVPCGGYGDSRFRLAEERYLCGSLFDFQDHVRDVRFLHCARRLRAFCCASVAATLFPLLSSTCACTRFRHADKLVVSGLWHQP
jgi:hypothetical protein